MTNRREHMLYFQVGQLKINHAVSLSSFQDAQEISSYQPKQPSREIPRLQHTLSSF